MRTRTVWLAVGGVLGWLGTVLAVGSGCGDDSGGTCVWKTDPGKVDTSPKPSDLDGHIKLMGDLELLDTSCPGSLWRTEGPYGPLKVVYLKGSHHDMGYEYGYLLGEEINQVWQVYVDHVVEAAEGQITGDMFAQFLDAAWAYLELHMPDAYHEEMQGAVEGAQDRGVDLQIETLQRFIALSNVSDYDGDEQTALTEIVGGHPPWPNGTGQVISAYLKKHRVSCSFFSAWSSRTKDGHLLSSRVLDWDSDSGLQDHILLTIYDPKDGVASMSFGYVGFLGVLGGMNEAGVSVAEVGSTNTAQTLIGMPWTIRYRLLLETATNLDEALEFLTDLEDYPNTVGYNFMLAWGDPVGGGAAAEAAAVETNALYSSVFRGAEGVQKEQDFYLVNGDGQAICLKDADGNVVVRDDMRKQEGEVVATTEDPSEYVHPGRPLPEAIYRGDDSFTKEIRVTQTAAHGPGDRSHGRGDPDRGDGWMFDAGSYQNRYMRYYCMIKAFEDGSGCVRDGVTYVESGEKKPIGIAEGVRLVRAAAMKGNIYAAVMDNTSLDVAIAFESGHGENWSRAADNDFLLFNLKDLLDRFRAAAQ